MRFFSLSLTFTLFDSQPNRKSQDDDEKDKNNDNPSAPQTVVFAIDELQTCEGGEVDNGDFHGDIPVFVMPQSNLLWVHVGKVKNSVSKV